MTQRGMGEGVSRMWHARRPGARRGWLGGLLGCKEDNWRGADRSLESRDGKLEET